MNYTNFCGKRRGPNFSNGHVCIPVSFWFFHADRESKTKKLVTFVSHGHVGEGSQGTFGLWQWKSEVSKKEQPTEPDRGKRGRLKWQRNRHMVHKGKAKPLPFIKSAGGCSTKPFAKRACNINTHYMQDLCFALQADCICSADGSKSFEADSNGARS
jgi:hypothetical protein